MQIVRTDSTSDLHAIYDHLNERYFGGRLGCPTIRWNGRLGRSAGRFIPVRWADYREQKAYPTIEIARYLATEPRGMEHIWDTLGHEMIHYWLWLQGRPYGHTAEFNAWARRLGVSRYNPIPKSRPYRHVYGCPHCGKEIPRRQLKRDVSACRECCDTHAGGRYDARFKLFYKGPYAAPKEGAPGVLAPPPCEEAAKKIR